MVLKVHGGLINDQFLTGNLRHYSVTGADFSNAISDGTFIIPNGGGPNIDLVVGEGQPVPDSAASIIMNEVAKLATVVITNPTAEGLYFALENDDNDWTIAELQTMIQTLGTVGVDGVDVSAAIVTGTAYILYQGGSGGSSDFLGLTDTPADYSGFAGYSAVVNPAEDGLIFVDVTGGGTTSLVNLFDTNPTAVPDGILRWNTAGNIVEYVTTIEADIVSLDASSFGGNLSPSDTDVQTAMETIDQMTATGGVDSVMIDGQHVLVLTDTTRGDKRLSVSEQTIMFSANKLRDLEWMNIGNAVSAKSSYVADFNGTVVYISGHCEETFAEDKDLHLYVNEINLGYVGTLSGGTNAILIANTLDLDFNKGDRLRLRAVGGTETIEDTVVKITIKWRAD